MAWTNNDYTEMQPWHHDNQNVHIIQQPVPQHAATILQQIPSAAPPLFMPPLRQGHIKEDLVELMLIQNAQMHQVIMNNMTMSALSSFGYWQAPPAPQPVTYPVVVEEDSSEIYHHHYQPVPVPWYPAWAPPFHPQAIMAQPDHREHQGSSHTPLRDRYCSRPQRDEQQLLRQGDLWLLQNSPRSPDMSCLKLVSLKSTPLSL